MNEWSVYTIRCSERSLYTGMTTDVQRRFGEHLSGDRTEAKYTKSFSSMELACEIPIGNRSLAAKIEYQIKRLPKQKKEFTPHPPLPLKGGGKGRYDSIPRWG